MPLIPNCSLDLSKVLVWFRLSLDIEFIKPPRLLVLPGPKLFKLPSEGTKLGYTGSLADISCEEVDIVLLRFLNIKFLLTICVLSI